MPLFEFICTECERPFEELVRSSTAVGEVICPVCGSAQVKKKLSTFASKVSGGYASSYGSAAACSPTGT